MLTTRPVHYPYHWKPPSSRQTLSRAAMLLNMFSRCIVFISASLFTVTRGQSSAGDGLYSSSSTTSDSVDIPITQPSPEVIYSWLPVSTLYTSNCFGFSTVTPAVIVTDVASGTAAVSSTNSSALNPIFDPGSFSTSTTAVVDSNMVSGTAAASSSANSYTDDMTSQTPDGVAAASTTSDDIQQSPILTSAATAASTTATGLDPGVGPDPSSSALLISTSNSTSLAQTSSPLPMSILPPIAFPTSTTLTTTSTAAPATVASSPTSPPPTPLTSPTTSYVWSSSTKAPQPTTIVTQTVTTAATSSALAFRGGKCDSNCKLYTDKENMICNHSWQNQYHDDVLISCKPKSITCTANPTPPSTLKKRRHYKPSEKFMAGFCSQFCTCQDGALSCGSTDFDDSCNGRCSNATITKACNCNWDPKGMTCQGPSNDWRIGGCACPNKGTKWPGQT